MKLPLITSPLFRVHLGVVLRAMRIEQNKTLREVSQGANVSLGYLSEIERGCKEISSEMLASVCDALDVPLWQVLVMTARVAAAPDQAMQGLTLPVAAA